MKNSEPKPLEKSQIVHLDSSPLIQKGNNNNQYIINNSGNIEIKNKENIAETKKRLKKNTTSKLNNQDNSQSKSNIRIYDGSFSNIGETAIDIDPTYTNLEVHRTKFDSIKGKAIRSRANEESKKGKDTIKRN